MTRTAARAGIGLGLGLVSYTALYFPYPEHSTPARVLHRYLEWIAAASAWVIQRFDPRAQAQGDMVLGQFPLQIVLDCAALDAQAMLSVAILVAAGSVPQKVAGMCAGAFLLGAFNIARISLLYAVGTHYPDWFQMLHEEVLQLGMVIAACALFAAWLHHTSTTPSASHET